MLEVIVWPGIIGGAAVGLYAVLQLWSTGYPLGCSTGYGNVCAAFSKSHYFSTQEYEYPNNWRLWFLFGIIGGGAIAAYTSGTDFSRGMSMGQYYDAFMPEDDFYRSLVLFGGGTLMGLGARMANGCTSGHAIAGISFLNLNSIILALTFFFFAIIVGQAMFWGM